jgi:hypothetical protein
VLRALVAGSLAAAVLAVAAASAAPTLKPPQWRLTFSGVQTLHWDQTSDFSDAGPCPVRHTGDQTIRFGTPRAFPARLIPTDDVIFGPVLRAHVLVGGRYRSVVPMVGSERRVYDVVQRPPLAGNCSKDAARYLADCSGTHPLVRGSGTFVDTRPPKARSQKVATRVPVGTGLLPRFPDCPIHEFDLRNDWVYPLFTYGDWAPLLGGSPRDRRATRLTARGQTSVCFAEAYPARHASSCGNPHVAEIAIRWQVALARLGSS